MAYDPPSPAKTGTNKDIGTQKGKLRPCVVKPDTHGFHPEDEDCPYCEPPEVPARDDFYTASLYGWPWG